MCYHDNWNSKAVYAKALSYVIKSSRLTYACVDIQTCLLV